MSGIALYVEGGGDSPNSKAEFRQGFDAFLGDLKSKARERGFRWKLVACGGRSEAHRNFTRTPPDARYPIRMLLVDSEASVARTPVLHLNDRDGWIIDSGMEACVHLMVQTMETWIVADPDALEIYYQPRFRASALPRALNLESVSKVDIEMALDEATKDTQKGKYKKIRHAKDLLARIDAEKVNSRCPHSKRFFEYVKSAIDRHPG